MLFFKKPFYKPDGPVEPVEPVIEPVPESIQQFISDETFSQEEHLALHAFQELVNKKMTPKLVSIVKRIIQENNHPESTI